jgi:hypothetical protein
MFLKSVNNTIGRRFSISRNKFLRIFNPTLISMLAIFITSLTFQSCGPSKQTSSSGHTILSAPVFPVSALTLAFNLELLKEIEKAGSKDYRPSQKLVEKYGLIARNDSVFITGYAKLKPDFKPEDLSDLAALNGNGQNNLYSAFLSFNNLNAFYQSTTVSYFEISTLNHLLKK